MHFVLPPEMTMAAAALLAHDNNVKRRDKDDQHAIRAKHTLTRLECVTFNAIECTYISASSSYQDGRFP